MHPRERDALSFYGDLIELTTEERTALRAKARLTLNPLLKYCPLKPHQKQIDFLKCPARIAMYGGSAGGGKSQALAMAALQYVHHSQYSAILFRRTYSDLSLPGGLISTFHDWLAGTDARFTAETKTWHFPSGATITFGYLDNVKDHYRYQSSQFQYLAFDEITQIDPKQYLYLHSRARRVKGVNIPIRIRAATNPGGIYHSFYKSHFITKPEDREFIKASWLDNPHLDHAEYSKALDSLDSVTRAQLKEGLWIEDASERVYKFDASKNLIESLPELETKRDKWSYVIGCDLGWHDESAATVLAFSQHDPTLYAIHTEKHPHMTISDLAAMVSRLMVKYPPDAIVCDTAGGSKQVVESLKTAPYYLPVLAADKTNKRGYIQLVNGDLEKGKFLLLTDETQPLQKEWLELPWKDCQHKTEHPSAPNHCSDSALYAYKYARHHYASQAESRPLPGTKAYEEHYEQQVIANWETKETTEWWE